MNIDRKILLRQIRTSLQAANSYISEADIQLKVFADEKQKTLNGWLVSNQ